MSAEDPAELREDIEDETRPETKDAAEEFLDELRRRGIIDED
jgi:hypothetical protein